MLRRIDVGLPELALPVRVYECRPEYGGEKGHAGSFQTSALGLISRLDRDRDIVEQSRARSAVFDIITNQVPVSIEVETE